jgi:hypothetical protein
MTKICILDTNTNKCINILNLDNDSDWVDHAHFIKSPRNDGEIGWTLLVNGEWDTGIVEPTLEEKIQLARQRRDKFLITVVDTMNAVRWETLTTEQKQEWMNYRQNLLDIPQQSGFPNNIIWPTKPN